MEDGIKFQDGGSVYVYNCVVKNVPRCAVCENEIKKNEVRIVDPNGLIHFCSISHWEKYCKGWKDYKPHLSTYELRTEDECFIREKAPTIGSWDYQPA